MRPEPAHRQPGPRTWSFRHSRRSRNSSACAPTTSAGTPVIV